MPCPNSITLTTPIKRRDTIIAQNLDNDIVMANIDSGHYFGVDKTSKRIWELIEPQTTCCQTICDVLCTEYNVDRATCEQDVLVFLQDLSKEGLIELA